MRKHILLIWLLALMQMVVSCQPDEPVTPPVEIDTVLVRDTVIIPDTIVIPDTILVPDTAVEHFVLHCVQPEFLKAGDTVALISPSYYTPMSTLQNAANVVRSWGLVPVIPCAFF